MKLVLTHDDSSVFPVDDEDYDVFFDDLQIEQAPSLSHLAFGLTDGVHFSAAYVLGTVIAVVACVLLSFGQLPALVLLVLAAGIILYGHRELKKAKSTMPSAR